MDAQAIVGVDYDEFKPETFRAFTVDVCGQESRFPTMIEAVAFAQSKAENILYLSSIENFAADLDERGDVSHIYTLH